MIHAIETRYKGYRFRSRLEARWAVFFDNLRIKWEYEPEGFDLGSLGWYLPDFLFPDRGTFAEIKPIFPTSLEIEKAAALPRCLVLWGMPGDLFQCACLGTVAPLITKIMLSGDEQRITKCIDICREETLKWWDERLLGVAVKRARSARFEHGETP